MYKSVIVSHKLYSTHFLYFGIYIQILGWGFQGMKIKRLGFLSCPDFNQLYELTKVIVFLLYFFFFIVYKERRLGHELLIHLQFIEHVWKDKLATGITKHVDNPFFKELPY